MAAIEKLKKSRAIQRTAFTKTYNALKAEIEAALPSVTTAEATLNVLTEREKELNSFDKELISALIDAKISDEEITKEMDSADEYKVKFETIKVTCQRYISLSQQPLQITQITPSINRNTTTQGHAVKFKLPKIELKKFNGDPREWLQFWSIFKKIHEDTKLSNEEKFQYLLQSMVQGSRASEVANSYPPSSENYEKVIDSLKTRFGRDDLLVEIYVRELLKLVINKSQDPVVKIYDKLETQLRALETLGVTTAMCAAMLFPLVESALPADILRVWQRKSDNGSTTQERLENLMKFLGDEVQNEERITMAKVGFEVSSEQNTSVDKSAKRSVQTSSNSKRSMATAAGLLTTEESKANICIFCQGIHNNAECDKAKQMTFNVRQSIAREHRVCYVCLKTNHAAKYCKSKIKCAWCSRKHVLLMCKQVENRDKTQSSSNEGNDAEKKVEKLTVSCNNVSLDTNVHLMTLQVKLQGPENEVVVRALIDPGSHRTYVLDDLAKRLGLVKVKEQTMVHLLFGGTETSPRHHTEYKLVVSNLNDKYECHITAYNEKKICRNLPAVKGGKWWQSLSDAGIHVHDNVSEPISLLIGADIAGRLHTGKIHQTKQGPTAIETKLGWVLLGRDNASEQLSHNDATLAVFTMFSANAKITDLWDLDVLGIRDPVETSSKEAHQAKIVKQFRDTTRLNEEGRYEVHLPWKENHPPLSSNRDSAEKRLVKLTSKLHKEQLYDNYQAVFDSWLSDGIIEKIPVNKTENSGYFLPHRHVVKENSTTRIRPVFDASASCNDGPSLNQCLETGPNLIELITNILLRFMKNKIGIAADIKKAFLQIEVTPADRDVLKFLWWEKYNPNEMIVYRHRRVVFGVNSSPFLLGATIELHLDNALKNSTQYEESEIIKKLKKSFYVDNCITSVQSPEEEIKFRSTAKKVMLRAGFDLRGWERTNDSTEKSRSSILGLIWEKRNDWLLINTSSILDKIEQPITKRKILSTAHKIFDPLGWACPTLLCPKLMLQHLWSENLAWDTEVPHEVAMEFTKWQSQLPRLSELKIKRWIFESAQEDNVQLHMFVDASKDAYAAALFIRIRTTQSGIDVHLIQAKTRVAPTKKVSIPRMEMLAATLGARLMSTMRQTLELPQAQEFFWSDSTTTLSWITRNKQWSRFIWNRVQEIRKLTDAAAWRHVPGYLNPADLPSRGCSVSQLVESQWWQGPAWLKLEESEWPYEALIVEEEQINSELSKKEQEMINATDNPEEACVANCTNISSEPDATPWYLRKFSKYNQVVRMLAWILRFKNNSRLKNPDRRKGDIHAEEYELAEKSLFRLSQKESSLSASDARLKNLNAYIDEQGLLRSRSLVGNRDDSLGFRFPVLLDPKHPLIKLLIEHQHTRLKHAGVSTTIAALRETVWILTCRRVVRTVINNCVVCRRHTAKVLQTPPACLPENRVRDAFVFEVVGIDYAGPLYLKDGSKAWVCLFTCAVYRAVHLELVSTLSTDGFFEALRRFIARRRRPREICVDNGTNFVGASNMLARINWDKLTSSVATNKIKWKFNPPSAPWWGGWWERLIRIIKDLLKRTLKRTHVSFEEMSTILCECEAVINSCPISQDKDNEQLIAISPEMLLKETELDGVPDLDHLESVSLSRHMKYRQRLRQELKRRFRDEYLGQLARRSKVTHNFSTVRRGDIVLVASDNNKRLDWPLARVIDIVPGKDGVPRIARLKTANGELIRPLQRIILLEGSQNVINNDSMQAKTKDVEAKDSKNDEVDIEAPSLKEPVKEESIPLQPRKTKCGRQILVPSRYQ